MKGRPFITALPATSRKTDASRRSSKTSRSNKASNSGAKPGKPAVQNRLVMVLVEVQKVNIFALNKPPPHSSSPLPCSFDCGHASIVGCANDGRLAIYLLL